jgi:hypothetical protein
MKKYILFPLLVIGAFLIASPAHAYDGRLGSYVGYDQYSAMNCGCTSSYGYSTTYGYNTSGYNGYNNAYMPSNYGYVYDNYGYYNNPGYGYNTNYGYGYNNGYYNSNGALVGSFLGSLAGTMITGGSYYRDQQYNFGGWDNGQSGNTVYYNNYNS